MSLEKDHATMVTALCKSGAEIIDDLTPLKAHALHMAVGVSGEAGELLDAVKKFVVYGKDLDRVNVVEEIGDIEFYLQGLRNAFDITREETLEVNIKKLGVRYSGGSYSDVDAQVRADKIEGE